MIELELYLIFNYLKLLYTFIEMSHIVYGQNKFICNFQLSSSIKDNVNKFFRVN